MRVSETLDHLLEEARRANERRLLVITGERPDCEHVCRDVLTDLDIGLADTVAVSDRDSFACKTISPDRSTELMGRTFTAIVLDLHAGTIPNLIGRATGAVDGGGLLMLLCPPFEAWPTRRDAFDEGLVVAPFTRADLRGGFKRRLADTLSSHPGVAIIEAETRTVLRDGSTNADPAERAPRTIEPPPHARFPTDIYERCHTTDQRRAVEAFESVGESPVSIVLSAERGRGKSSAAGLAAAALAREGRHVGITAAAPEHTRAAFERVRDVVPDTEAGTPETADVEVSIGGRITYYNPLEAIELVERGEVDVLIVDEAAALPVRTLERALAADAVAFVTTRHGYEGSGHGFSIKFREVLARSRHHVIDRHLERPIRYGPEDPIEQWVNRMLLLDARPPVAELVETATPRSVAFEHISADALETDETRFREVMGLLALAHYRTEPNDLARVLDAPNLEVVALLEAGHVACIALLAREGGLSERVCERAYRGERLRGNLLPDIFLNVFRDTTAPMRPGLRVVRIATHHAARRRGLASHLIQTIRAEYSGTLDWFGTGFGATPDLVRFWRSVGFVPISLSASRNRASGAYSAIMLDTAQVFDPAIPGRFGGELADRLLGSLSDVHRNVEPEVIRQVLRGIPEPPGLDIDDTGWRHLVAAADGPGRYDLHPLPARKLVLDHLVSGENSVVLEPSVELVLIAKVLQGRSWSSVTAMHEYPAVAACRRAVGEALSALLDEYGGETVHRERRRLSE